MEFTLRRLLRISVTLKNLSFSKVQCIHFNTPSASLFCKDEIKQYNLKDDVVLKTMQNLSPKNLLNYIDSNKYQIECKHIMIALYSLHNFYKNKTNISDSANEQIDFTKLCTCLRSQIKQLSPIEVIDALNLINLLQVPSSNLFVITLLNCIKDSYEELSFQEINKLSTLLAKFVPTDLINEINTLLQEKFCKIISTIDEKNLDELMNALQFASENIKDYKIIDILVNNIENYQSKFTLEEALDTFSRLIYVKNISHKLKKTEEHLKKVITNNVDKLEYNHVLKIIEDVSFQINSNHEEVYDEVFIDELVQKIIFENWNFVKGNKILHCLNSIRHVQMDLLDYLSAKLYEDQTNLRLNMNLLHPLVTGIVLADYKPVFWDAIKNSILNVDMSGVEHLKLCYYVFDLACLECFEPRLLHEVFSAKFILSEEHQEILLKLHQIVKILCPLYDGPLPSEDILESFKNMKQDKNKKFPLLAALEQAVGGDTYIQTNVKTSLEHYIDHVIIMNKSGYPIAINSYGTIENHNGITYIEDLIIPPGTQTFLILYAGPDWYARNTQRILGPYSLLIKTLETMSYTVISIDGKKWQEMSLNKQISYIMQAIQLRFETDSISTTS